MVHWDDCAIAVAIIQFLVLIAVDAGSRIVRPRDIAEPGDVSD
jgi:hypothetical protein